VTAAPRAVLAGLAADVRSGRRSAVDLVQASLDRIAAAAEINAVIAIRAEEALHDARAIDERVGRGEDPGPLAGLPFLSKDNEDAAGLPTTFGSHLFDGATPAASDGVVAGRLRRAGAVLVGKTNIPELAFEGFSANRRYGVTRNPWALAFSPGGSSGGSGAALAAGLAAIATATDVGGSIRIPASACGLVGLKPTGGLIGRDPILPSLDLNNHGPLAQTTEDARLLLEVLRGPVPGDPGALPTADPAGDTVPTRVVATIRFAPGPEAEPEVVRLFDAALDAIALVLGLPVERLEPDELLPTGYDPDDWFRIIAVEQAWDLGWAVLDREWDRLDPAFRSAMDAARGITLDQYAGARRRRFRYTRDLDGLLGEDGVIVTPTIPVSGFTAEGGIAGHHGPNLPWWAFNTEIQNLTGHPAISLPAGRAATGVPFGLQVTAPRHRDDLLFGFAARWEAARPWPLVADGYRVLGA
jgi:Asp-tRNA(Asn)/Glu-tRNA(Gln) amidotransferase A subunit family amidase